MDLTLTIRFLVKRVYSVDGDYGSGNSGQYVTFYGANSYRNARFLQNVIANNLFALQKVQPQMVDFHGLEHTRAQVNLSNNRIGVNTTSTSGVDPDNGTNRNYILNVEGDMNLNGQFFQNNAEFVIEWTEASNAIDIYRLSKVGINQADPDYTLDISIDANVEVSSELMEQHNT